MNSYIQHLKDDLISNYIERNLDEADELISKVKNLLYEIKSDKDKLGLLTAILEANETKYQKHLKTCENPKTCDTNIGHQKIAYYLQQELDELGFNDSSDHFTWEEKHECNSNLDKLFEKLQNSNQIVNEKLTELQTELEELKNLYILGKKNWRQQFAGKFSDMVMSGVISELTAKPIIKKILSPGFNFITNKLIG